MCQAPVGARICVRLQLGQGYVSGRLQVGQGYVLGCSSGKAKGMCQAPVGVRVCVRL